MQPKFQKKPFALNLATIEIDRHYFERKNSLNKELQSLKNKTFFKK